VSLLATDSILIASRLLDVRRTIAEAAHAAGRNPEDITLVGVTKFFAADVARDAIRCGLNDLGENRVQELLQKREELNELGFSPNWHLIGTLQKNKVRHVIGMAHLIHSIDSIELLDEVSRRSLATSCLTDVLIQVNTAGEASKHGFDPDELPSAAEKALTLPGVRLRGLMTMAPLVLDADETLPVFEKTRLWFDRLAETIVQDESFDILSMGMSHDYVQAIRCGTTMVRIGSAIFGPRPPQPDVPA
jgi:hypothetical protein